MTRPRYWRTWEAGYRAGTEAATAALREHLRAGGQVAVAPFTGDITVRFANGAVAHADNVEALAKFHQREARTGQPE